MIKSIINNKNTKIIDIFVIFISLAFLYSTYEQLFRMQIFGYDEAKYSKDFSFKLVEDGRWLNHILLDILRLISLKFWAIFYVTGLFYVMYRIAFNAFNNITLAVAVASAVMVTTPYVHQSMWPATSSIGVIVFLLLLELQRRGISRLLIYLISGILFFGTLQSFYFLVPLIFIGEFIDENKVGKNIDLIYHLLYWVLGAVVGVLFMSVMLWLMIGNFGVRPAAWRRIQPILSFQDLIRNINYVFLEFQQKITSLSLVLGSYFWGAWILVILINIRKNIFVNLSALMLIVIIGISFFVFSIPLAPVIQERSLFALSAAFVFLVVLSTWGGAGFIKILALILLMYCTYKYSLVGMSYLEEERLQNNHIYQKIEAGMPKSVLAYKGVIQFGVAGGASNEAKAYNSAPIMHGLFYAMNFKEYKKCDSKIDFFCKSIKLESDISIVKFADGNLIFNENKDGWLIIRYE